MKKKQVYILLLSISAISCKNLKEEALKKTSMIEQLNKPQKTIKNSQQNSTLNVSEDNSEQQIVQENINKLEIRFSKINSIDYLGFKQKYSNGIEVDSTIANEAGSSFSLTINNKKKEFSCGIDYKNCNYYRGFLKPLSKYVLTYCGTGYCGTYLLDKNSGTQNYLESPFDSECEIPSLSKDKNKLIGFSSSAFDRESFIALYKKDINTQKIDFEKYNSFNTSDWRIKEIIWIDNNSIALKVYDEYGGKNGSELINVRYLKGEIK